MAYQMTEHKAPPEHWEQIQRWTHVGSEYSSCLLELRARVEALEAAAKPAESNCQEMLDDSLLDRLEAKGYWRASGRKAARVIAAWLRKIGNNRSADDIELELQ